MYEPTELEEFECLVLGKSCSFGICCECTIGVGYNKGGSNVKEISDNDVYGRFVDKPIESTS